jgi:hypothetical protein
MVFHEIGERASFFLESLAEAPCRFIGAVHRIAPGRSTGRKRSGFETDKSTAGERTGKANTFPRTFTCIKTNNSKCNVSGS